MVICCQEIHSPVWKNHPRNQTGSILVLIVHLTQETTELAWRRWARLLGSPLYHQKPCNSEERASLARAMGLVYSRSWWSWLASDLLPQKPRERRFLGNFWHFLITSVL